MSAEQAANAGVISEIPATTTESTAVVQPEPTQTLNVASILDKLGVPAEKQAEVLEARKEAEPEPTIVEPEAPEAIAEEVETTEEEPEVDPEPVTTEQPGFIKKEVFDQRVGKLTKQKLSAIERAEQAEEEAARLREQLETAQPITVQPTDNDMLASVQTHEQLSQAVSEARLAREVCRKNPDGYVINEGTDKEIVVTREQVAETLSKAEDLLMFEAPKKQAQLRQKVEFDNLAKEHYPKLFDRSSEDYQVGHAVLREFPSLVNHPSRNLVIGDYLRGVRLRLADQKTNGKPKVDLPEALTRPQAPIAPSVPASQRGNTPAPGKKKVEAATTQAYQAGGSRDSLAAMMKAKRESRTRQTADAVLA